LYFFRSQCQEVFEAHLHHFGRQGSLDGRLIFEVVGPVGFDGGVAVQGEQQHEHEKREKFFHNSKRF